MARKELANAERFIYYCECIIHLHSACNLQACPLTPSTHLLTLSVQGNETIHVKLRHQVIEYLRANEEMFAPFIEDDESFASYVSRMNKDGCWTGNLELVASNMLLANRGPLVRYTSLGDER